MSAHLMEGCEILPKAESYRLAGVELAEVLTLRSFFSRFLLQVGGTKPYVDLSVGPLPLAHTTQPACWNVEVVGRPRSGMLLSAEMHHAIFPPLSGITDTCGAEVVGTTRSERLEVPSEEPAGDRSSWPALRDHESPGPPVPRVRGDHDFPTAAFSVELSRHEPQGLNPRNLQLVRKVHESSNPMAQVITALEACYWEGMDFKFDTVTILPDGGSVPFQEVL